MKIAINRCWGGFGLSKKALQYLGSEWDGYGYRCDDNRIRMNAKLIECIEKLGEKANGECSEIKIVEIPDDVEWYIDDYDGMESVHEKHRVWE